MHSITYSLKKHLPEWNKKINEEAREMHPYMNPALNAGILEKHGTSAIQFSRC